jgi:hypothetical protein
VSQGIWRWVEQKRPVCSHWSNILPRGVDRLDIDREPNILSVLCARNSEPVLTLLDCTPAIGTKFA